MRILLVSQFWPSAADPVEEEIGAIAERIWRAAGPATEPEMHVAGVRPGETMTEILVGPGEELGEEVRMGAAAIVGEAPTDAAAAVVEEVERCVGAEERRQAWLGALAGPRAPATP